MMAGRGRGVLLAASALALGFGPLHGQDGVMRALHAGESSGQWRLPNRLREISGLAVTDDGRLLAHDDERAVIYEVDLAEERLVKAFAIGSPPVRDDFEGIAYAHNRVYLITSTGRIFESREGDDDDRLTRYNTYGTGLGDDDRCEVEGLTYEPANDELLLICKQTADPSLRSWIAIFRWSFSTRDLISRTPMRIPLAVVRDETGHEQLHPSGIERHPDTGHLFIVAATEQLLIEVTPDRRIINVVDLSDTGHRQPEGIAFLHDGSLVLADEGGSRRARLTRYAGSR